VSTCECGEAKSKNARCRYLDGATCGEYAIIMALRECSEPATVAELVEATGYLNEQVYRTLARLERRGRIAKLERNVTGRRSYTVFLTVAP